MKNLLIFSLLLLLVATQLKAQDSLATVYFYRVGKFAGSFIGYDVKHSDKVIGRIKSGTVVTYRCPPGLQTFSATTEGESSIRLNIQAGQTYFVECSLAAGVVVGRPTFRQVFSAEARKEIGEIDAAIAGTIPVNVVETIMPADTARALHNLYQRKRKGGTARAAVFGALGLVSLIGTVSYKPNTVTVNQGSAGTQTIETSSGPPAINYVFIGFSTIMFITGITQTTKYSSKNLDALLNDYKQGKPLPATIKGKLKKKDFK
jgi:hypothetical protein